MNGPTKSKAPALALGINLLLFGTGPYPPELLHRLRRIGYRHVEVPIFGGTMRKWKNLGAMIAETGMSFSVSSAMPTAASLVSGEADFRRADDFFGRLAEATRAVGARRIIGPLYHPLGDWAQPTRQDVLQAKLTRRLSRIGLRFVEAELELILEPLNRFETNVLNTQADAERVCSEVASPWLGWMSDSFHAHIEESSQTPITSPYWKHVHASESHRGAAGTGQIHWRKWAQSVRGRFDLVVFEAFASRQGPLAAATRIWRDIAGDPLHCATTSFHFLNQLLNPR